MTVPQNKLTDQESSALTSRHGLSGIGGVAREIVNSLAALGATPEILKLVGLAKSRGIGVEALEDGLKVVHTRGKESEPHAAE